MEVPRERPTGRRNRERRRARDGSPDSIQSAHSNQSGQSRDSFHGDDSGVEDTCTSMPSELDDHIRPGIFNELKVKLNEQVYAFINEKEVVCDKKDTEQDKVITLFRELRAILDTKENEILDELDAQFNRKEDFISDLIRTTAADKRDLDAVEANQESENGIGTLRDIETCIASREDAMKEMTFPEFCVGGRVKEDVNGLDIGRVRDVMDDDVDGGGDVIGADDDVSRVVEETDVDSIGIRVNTGLRLVDDDLAENDDTPTNESEEHMLEPRGRNSRSSTSSRNSSSRVSVGGAGELSDLGRGDRGSVSSDVFNSGTVPRGSVPGGSINSGSVPDGAVGGIGVPMMPSAVPLPTAPPITSMSTEEEPPPYWQVVGEQNPNPNAATTTNPGPGISNQQGQQQQAPMPEIPGYYDINHTGIALPTNKLELWHSFPVSRQYDRHAPRPIALIWNGSRICLADKANQRIKFFFPNGQLLAEMYLAGYDIDDVAFLEEHNQEGRYLVTCHRAKVLMIISIDAEQHTKLVRKLPSTIAYKCISRGPYEQTLVGGDGGGRDGGKVNIFNFMGQVIRAYRYTPNWVPLGYPKSVLVHENMVVISDYKLNTVAVFNADGTAMGEYKGTAESPLINPLDITLDNCGNIMILDGELPNIHVIDRDCAPIEIIRVPKLFSDTASPKLAAFDLESKRLAVTRSTGDIAVFTFRGDYDALPQRHLGAQVAPGGVTRRQPEVLPLIEGMLPSTIESMIARPSRNRNWNFHL